MKKNSNTRGAGGRSLDIIGENDKQMKKNRDIIEKKRKEREKRAQKEEKWKGKNDKKKAKIAAQREKDIIENQKRVAQGKKPRPNKEQREGKVLGVLIVVFAVLIALVLMFIVAISVFRVKEVEISGNETFTDDQLKEILMDDRYSNYTLYDWWKYKFMDVEEIPFVEKVEFHMKSPSSVEFVVYEKAIIGFVENGGEYVYFDKDGYVAESSDMKKLDLPMVTGIKVDDVSKGEKLDIDSKVLDTLLEITKALQKYEVEVEKISFDDQKNITLCIGKARVSLGKSGYMSEKISELHYLLDKIKDKRGVLKMDNFTGNSEDIFFEEEPEPVAPEVIPEEGAENSEATEGQPEGANPEGQQGTEGQPATEGQQGAEGQTPGTEGQPEGGQIVPEGQGEGQIPEGQDVPQA